MAIDRTEHASGLRVVTERMPGVRSVALGFWALAGSRDEPPPISGSSHFLEHLLFKGTKARSARDIAEAFDAVGGDVNAFTAKEYTCFYARVLDRDLPMAVEHLADMLQHSVIRRPDFDAEKQVILEEINVHEDTPDDVVHDLFTETLWPSIRSAARSSGRSRSIEAATRDQVHASTGGTTCRGTSSSSRRATSGTRSCSQLLPARHGHGAGVRGGAPRRRGTLRTGRAPPAPSGRALGASGARPSRRTSASARTGLPRNDPDRFAFGDREHGARRRDVVAAVPGDPREARPRYCVYSYHSQFAEAGLFSRLRGDDAGAGEGGRLDSSAASSTTSPTAGSAERSSIERRGT